MITRERYTGNDMTKKQFNSWVKRNTKLICDGTGYLYGVSLKEFDVDFNLLSVKNKKEKGCKTTKKQQKTCWWNNWQGLGKRTIRQS